MATLVLKYTAAQDFINILNGSLNKHIEIIYSKSTLKRYFLRCSIIQYVHQRP